jgi:hypothetical protein
METDSPVLPPDPLADLLVDERWRAVHLAWLSEVAAEHGRFDDEPNDAVGPDAVDSDAVDADGPGGLPWSVMSGVAHDVALDRLEDVARSARIATARQYAAIAEILQDAAEMPEPWVGADPTVDPLWVDPRRRSVSTVRRERREFAVRAAAADIAVRLRIADTTVRTRAAHAKVLRERCPGLWAAFKAGDVDERNAVTAAELAGSLPHDDADLWNAFDNQVAAVAGVLTPAKFRVTARAVHERVHPESLDARARRAAEKRGVWVGPELDGMATLSAYLPAADAYEAKGRLDAIARSLRSADDEVRTLGQLRADAFTDLLTMGITEATREAVGGRSRPAIAVTVPVLTMLDQSDEPATLEGYGPIDTDTATRLAGAAKSWVRILTHPVTGAVLDVDRRTYRPPKDLRRWVEVHHPTCIRPGCRRPARECDLDHLIEWQYGGATRNTNLAPECEPDHVLRHNSRWDVHIDPDTGETYWTSPTGRVTSTDPAPF